MNRLALVLALALPVTACTAVDTGTGFLDVTLSLDGGCGNGVTAEVTATNLTLDDAFVFDFACADGGGSSPELPDGDYEVYVDILDGTSALVAQSAIQTAYLDAGTDVFGVNFAFPTDGAFFSLGWTISDTASTPLNCSDAGSDQVSVLATYLSTSDGFDILFNCADGLDGATVVSDKMALGDYQVILTLLETGTEAVLSESDDFLTSLDYGNQINFLGTVGFVVF